jgi:hypothetical protein
MILNDIDLGGIWAGPGVNRWLADSTWRELGMPSSLFPTKEEADACARALALTDLRPWLDWFRDNEDADLSPESIALRVVG